MRPDIKFTPDRKKHTTDPDPRKGTVTIRYGNGRQDRFNGIARREFFPWAAGKFNGKPPHGVRLVSEEE